MANEKNLILEGAKKERGGVKKYPPSGKIMGVRGK